MTGEDILPPDAPKVHHAILDLWLTIRQDRSPCRTDFEIETLHKGSQEAYEILARFPDGLDPKFHFHRVSRSAEERLGLDLNTRDVEEAIDEKLFPSVSAHYIQAIKCGQPHYWERFSSLYGREQQHYKRLLLPLVDEQNQGGWLLSSIVWPFHEGF